MRACWSRVCTAGDCAQRGFFRRLARGAGRLLRFELFKQSGEDYLERVGVSAFFVGQTALAGQPGDTVTIATTNAENII